ncbi:MAG: FHA domain-containing protein, partial [Chloroflexi bacterium]|nr:FHA domain-containing protein [Chloroflexota bacterium]
FLWMWFHSWTGVNAMAISLVIAALAFGLTKWSPYRGIIKMFITAGAVATIPLGFDKMGIVLTPVVYIPMENDQISTYLSFFGSVLTVSVGVPYLFHQVFRAASGKVTGYLGNASMYRQPQPAPAGAAGAGHTMNFQAGPRMGETVNMGRETISIGRSPENDIVIDDPTVSRKHARVVFDGNQYVVEDLASTAGVKVNGNKVQKAAMPVGATMKLGDTEIVFGETRDKPVQPRQAPAPRQTPGPAQPSNNPAVTRVIGKQLTASWLAVTAGPDTGSTLQLTGGDNFIGRGRENGLVLGDSYVSSRHAMVRVEDGKSYIYDIGSKGGTKVNGTSIDGHHVGPNSVICLGETELSLVPVDRVQQGRSNVGNGETMMDLQGQSGGVLVVRSGADAGKSYNLAEGDNHIGRDPSCNVRLSDESVSRQHALVRCENGVITLFDVGSRSGTEIDGKTLGGHPLNDGDTVSVGRTAIRLMAPAG